MWKQVKVRYNKMDHNGQEKLVNDPFLVDAVSATEAEAHITKIMEEVTSGDFSVGDITNKNVEHIKDREGDYFYEVKVEFESPEEKKPHTTRYMVAADDVGEALSRTEDYVSEHLWDWRIKTITETPIVEMYPYHAPEDPEPNQQGFENPEGAKDREG